MNQTITSIYPSTALSLTGRAGGRSLSQLLRAWGGVHPEQRIAEQHGKTDQTITGLFNFLITAFGVHMSLFFVCVCARMYLPADLALDDLLRDIFAFNSRLNRAENKQQAAQPCSC